jgi:hypothetical protein
MELSIAHAETTAMSEKTDGAHPGPESVHVSAGIEKISFANWSPALAFDRYLHIGLSLSAVIWLLISHEAGNVEKRLRRQLVTDQELINDPSDLHRRSIF